MGDKTYRVVRITGLPRSRPITDWSIKQAQELQSKYGLTMFTIEEIIQIWGVYSDDMCAGWLADSPGSVQEAFGVELEEV